MTVESVLTPIQPISDKEFNWLREFLRQQTGIELKDGKQAMVMGRLERRLRYHQIATYGEYLARLGPHDRDETTLAIDLLTTNETYFFRESAHFDFLGQLARTWQFTSAPRRIWSAASSTGCEAFTIAMVLSETLLPGQTWQVVGTDISSRVVETAQRAMYPIELADRIPKYLLKKYCLRGRNEFDGFFAIDPAVRDHLDFRQANLLALPSDLGQYDVIFLRNVMIYFGLETKRELVRRLIDFLRPGGYLILSHSENLNGINPDLITVQPSIYRTRSHDN